MKKSFASLALTAAALVLFSVPGFCQNPPVNHYPHHPYVQNGQYVNNGFSYNNKNLKKQKAVKPQPNKKFANSKKQHKVAFHPYMNNNSYNSPYYSNRYSHNNFERKQHYVIHNQKPIHKHKMI